MNGCHKVEPWKPLEVYDWETGGRTLSAEELKILRKLLRADGAGEQVRRPMRHDRQYFEQE